MKENSYLWVIGGILVLILGYYTLLSNKKQAVVLPNPLNTIYKIEGQDVALVGGVSQTQLTPGSLTAVITRYLGNQVTHDFNGDGKDDVAFILTQEIGGSGTYYYLVPAINTEKGYVGGSGFFLGDRISPQKVEMSANGVVVVNFDEKIIGQSFSTNSVKPKTLWFKYNPSSLNFAEVAQPVTSKVNPSTATLDMQKWQWVSTSYKGGINIYSKDQTNFVLVFKDSATFSATTDCNSINGDYTLENNKISFSNIVSTKMYCEDSQESNFISTLEQVEAYHFGPKGELIFDLKSGGGSAVFQ